MDVTLNSKGKCTLILVLILSSVVAIPYISADKAIDSNQLDVQQKLPPGETCGPLVIGHRGASGYVPEHTLGSYALAITMGADYIEPDLVMTKDGEMVARHDNELGMTTDIAKHPEFADRYRKNKIDGVELSGWFTEDFTLDELKTLRAIERIPNIRPGNARLDGAFQIPTLQEIIDLAKSMQTSEKRTIGIYPEIKHSTYFKNLGLAMERPLVQTLHSNGYVGQDSPVFIQSFEIDNLKELSGLTEIRLLQLFNVGSDIPADQLAKGNNLTYAEMSTQEGLREIAGYADAVGPDKDYIIPRDGNNKLTNPTEFVVNAHNAGLKVHPYTFRAENFFLPTDYRSVENEDYARGDLVGEIKAFLEAGIDGFFTDQADIGVKLKGKCD